MALRKLVWARLAAQRHRAVVTIAAVGAITMAFVGVAPVTSAASSDSSGRGVDATEVQEDEVLVAFAELRLLIDQLQADGEVTFGGARRMLASLGLAEFYYDIGYNQRAILSLETFKRSANDPLRVSDLAREQLVAAADELIVLLRASA